MLPCPSCDRHVRGEERACPFCASPLRSTRGPWNGTAAVVIAVGSVLFACGPAVSDTGDTIETSSTEDGVESTTGSAEVSTGAGTTVPPTTDPTMAMTSTTSLGDTSTGGSTTWEDDTFDTACGFYGGCPTDVGDMPYECDVFMQDCPDGQRCNPWADDGGNVWNASRCVPEDVGAGTPGEPCTVEGSGFSGVDTCAEGAMCFHVDPETLEGVCVELCSGTVDVPVCLEGTCVLQFEAALPLCLETCDPEMSTCLKTEVCEPVLDPVLDTQVCNPA
jgi:hypothetical protein